MDLSTKIGWLLVHLAKLDVGLLWEAKKFLWQGWAMGGKGARVGSPYVSNATLPFCLAVRRRCMAGA